VYPVLVTQARDQPLHTPPSTPPPPVLQYPFYLGLTNRIQHPDDPDPEPPTGIDPEWYLEIAPRELPTVIQDDPDDHNADDHTTDDHSTDDHSTDDHNTDEHIEGDDGTGSKAVAPVWMEYSSFVKCFR